MQPAASVVPATVGLGACSGQTGDSTIAPEQAITHDINAARGRSPVTLPADERLVQQPPVPPSRSANARGQPNPGNLQAGHDFALGTCTPCHVVSPKQKSPVHFANAPDFRVIANAPVTTAIGLNIWLTNPHATMPELVLDPQEAADVIAYILSLRDQRCQVGDGRRSIRHGARVHRRRRHLGRRQAATSAIAMGTGIC
jgi:hypothetical protein